MSESRILVVGATGQLGRVIVRKLVASGARVRALARNAETLARHAGLADFCFAMQGLGTGPISLFGTEAQKRKYLPPVMRGKAIAAFALSEPQAGSDVSAIATRATRSGNDYVLNSSKTCKKTGRSCPASARQFIRNREASPRRCKARSTDFRATPRRSESSSTRLPRAVFSSER